MMLTVMDVDGQTTQTFPCTLCDERYFSRDFLRWSAACFAAGNNKNME
jgi:hypothetical protein